MTSNEPENKRLYETVKKEAKQRFKVWPSAYASGWLVKEYNRRGGTYTNTKSKERPLERWYKEEWINVCELPKVVPCGRSKAEWKDYPYCRPKNRISVQTPKTAGELTKEQIEKRCKKKKENPKKRVV